MRPKQSHNHKHSRFKATITAIDVQSERQTLPYESRTIPPNRHSPINRTYAKLFRGSLVFGNACPPGYAAIPGGGPKTLCPPAPPSTRSHVVTYSRGASAAINKHLGKHNQPQFVGFPYLESTGSRTSQRDSDNIVRSFRPVNRRFTTGLYSRKHPVKSLTTGPESTSAQRHSVCPAWRTTYLAASSAPYPSWRDTRRTRGVRSASPVSRCAAWNPGTLW